MEIPILCKHDVSRANADFLGWRSTLRLVQIIIVDQTTSGCRWLGTTHYNDPNNE